MVLAMMAFAAMGAGAFMLGDIFINNNEVLRKDARTEAYRHLVGSVKKNLFAGNNCTNALGSASGSGRTIAAALVPGLGAPIDIPIKLGDEQMLLGPDWKAKTGTSIRRIMVQLVKPGRKDPISGLESNVRLTLSPGNTKILKAGYFRIIIEPDHKGINVWKKDAAGKYINENLFIPIFAYYDATSSEIYSCFDPASDATFCTEVQKGAYNHDSNIPSELRCQPDLQCFQAKGGVLDSGQPCEAPYLPLKIGKTAQFCTWCNENPIPGSVLAQLQAFYSGDIEGLTCDSTGVVGTQYTGVEAFKFQQEYGDAVVTDAGADTSASAGLAQCQATTVSCVDDPSMPPSGPMGTPTDSHEGGLDGNFCLNDCPPYNIKPGPYCTTAGNPCPGDDPATQCYDECNAVAITSDPDPATCVNECTGDTYACCVDDPATCTDECTGDTTACGSPSSPSGCFVAGTRVRMSDGSEKNIEDVLQGDFVLNGDEQPEKVIRRVIYDYNGLVYNFNGGRHFFTPNHPFKTLEGWKSLDPKTSMKESKIFVSLLREGDIVITKYGLEPIYTMEGIPYENKVYNFNISGSHEYFADDYLTHNMKPVSGDLNPIP